MALVALSMKSDFLGAMQMPNPQYRAYIQTWKAMDQLYHQQAVRRELPDSALWLAVSLYERGQACTPTELYADCAMSKQTGHSALLWLEKRGLIRQTPDPADRRSKRVEWTGKGQAFVQSQIAPFLAAEAAAFEALTSEEQRTLTALTEKLTAALKTEMAATPSGKGTI